ncbi:MAG: BCCT family transporter [Myxococcota bacterium]
MSEPRSPSGPESSASWLVVLGLEGGLARVALVLVVGAILFGLISVDSTMSALGSAKHFVVGRFDWLFVLVVNLSVLAVLIAAILPSGRLRLGTEEDRPAFSRLSWFAMLFSAGLASGLLYWATAEPILHAQSNPFLPVDNSGSVIADASERAVWGMRITLLHWGVHGWALYVLAALAISIYAYRHDQRLRFSTALYPLLGAERLAGWPGRLIDLLALLGTVAGVATSIGLSASSMNSTFASLTGIPVGMSQQVVIIFAICALGVTSALTGLARGIRRLSELNVWVSAALVLAFLFAGPTLELFQRFLPTLFDYGLSAIPTGLWLGETVNERAWQADWTIFYWGWWLAWTPFVSLFIARISKGRTIREFVLAVMLVPSGVTVVWMVVLGGTALSLEAAMPGSVSGPVNQDYGQGLVAVIDQLGPRWLSQGMIATASFLLLTWLITSLDSAVLIICHLLGVEDRPGAKVFWGISLAAVAAILLRAGGLTALQSASIVLGFPLALVVLAIVMGLGRDLARHL